VNDVYVCKTVAMTAFGPTVDDLWNGLMEGRSALRPITKFPTTNYLSQYAGCMDWLPETGPGRTMAVVKRLLNDIGPIPEGTRLVLATTKGEMDRLEEYCRTKSVCPIDGAPMDLLKKVAELVGCDSTAINLNAACASSTIAIANGAAAIAEGLAGSVLVLAFDFLSEFVFSGFSALKGMSEDPSRPFDVDRDGLSLGEGSAAVLITNRDVADASGLTPVARLVGWGCANDANHVTAPAKDAFGLRKAMNYALDKAGVTSDAVGAFNAHGTGTVYNDLMEITAVRGVFGEGPIPMHSIKGAIGHTLGAAGAIEVAVAVKSLQEKLIPPTVGMTTPEPAGSNLLSAEPQSLERNLVLTSNSGFGGINGALLVAGLETKPTSVSSVNSLKAGILGVGWVCADGRGSLGRTELPEFFNGIMPKLARSDVFDDPDKRFGRMDDFSKVGLAAITFALRDAKLEEWTEKRPFGIVAATDYGCTNTDMAYFDTVVPQEGKLASPNLFAYTLPNCFLGEAAIRFGLAGSNYILNTMGDQLCSAFRVGLEELALGDSDLLVVGINNPELTMSPDSSRLAGALFFVLGQGTDRDPIATVELNGTDLSIDGDVVADSSAILDHFRDPVTE
jgi:3-oxoacyl-[acyl-carrier-protein] synthase II